MIPTEELGELMWGNGGSSNPIGALKNLIYRLRNILKQLGTAEYIVSQAGRYGWNNEIEICSDVEKFKYYAEQTRESEGNTDLRIKKYEQALACYKKPCTSILTSESWFAVRFTYYHSVYLRLVNEACELCNSMQEYDKVQKICGQVLANDELSEDAHYWLIKNWIGLGDTDNALKQYEIAVKILYEKLGTYSSRKMQELYDEILGMNSERFPGNAGKISTAKYRSRIRRVFFLRIHGIREIYRLEARRALRTGITEYVMLLTIRLDLQDKQADPARIQYYRKKASTKLWQVLKKYLRMGDVVARYSDEQYLVMLPYCNYESSQKVARRILSNFRKVMGSQKITVKVETRDVSMDS
ncbi:MAG: BTAD domain-containing putative transcriptional regulator [Blautia wexlerae]